MASCFLRQLLKIFVFYVLLFALCRAIFLLYFFREVTSDGIQYFFLPFWEALPLDISAACYLLFFPVILLLAQTFSQGTILRKVMLLYLMTTSFFIVLLSIAEIGVYREVHVKVYFNLLTHLQHVDELFHSVSVSLLVIILLLVASLSYGCFKILQKLFAEATAVQHKINFGEGIKIFFAFVAAVIIMAIGCRGGLQPIPINEGEVYFSRNQCVNDATVNPLWNIVHSYIETRKVLNGNAYKVMSDEDADSIVQALYSVEKDTTISLFKTQKPNVCFLILESWSADLIESLGGYKGITPNFEKLIKEGYLFSNIKPTGHVSDQGIPGILSGYPALPIGSAINQPEKQPLLPCINNELRNAGYYSSFFFGGQLIYGNIKSYIYYNQFNQVIEQANLPSSISAGRLGIHDSAMLAIWMDSLNQMQQPFFSCLFTLSSHSPFDVVKHKTINWGTMDDLYLNSVVYTDIQLDIFFEEAKKQPWYSNTIFVLVADHSHGTPKNYEYCSSEFYHIPLLIVGGALKDEFRGKNNERIGSQLDISSTLLHQLNLNSKDYRWSKNLMNPYSNNFAFYTFNEGFGFVEDSQHVIWNKKFTSTGKNTAKTPQEKIELHAKGAAMLQVIMKDFLKN